MTYTAGKLDLLQFGPPTAARNQGFFVHVHELLLSTSVVNGSALRLISLF